MRGETVPPEQRAPLIVFVHVPKTAGSTVNAVMKGGLPSGCGHIEDKLSDDVQFRKIVNNLAWISGHVSRERLAARIREVSRRPVRFFSCVRHATDHLASHYNWLISRGGEFGKDSNLSRIYSAIVGNGFTPDGVIRTLKECPDLLNFQTRFLLGSRFDGSDNEFRAALESRFELIAVDPEAVVSSMLGRRIATMRRDNVATYAFDPGIFYDARVLDFLAEANMKDEKVYRVVSTLRGVAPSISVNQV